MYSVNVTDFHDKLVEHNSMDDVIKAFVNQRRSCHARTTMVVATVTCNNVSIGIFTIYLGTTLQV